MNFTKIFEMQKELDSAIMKTHNITNADVREKRILALIVEMGEFANEYSPFKYWKKNIVIDRAKLVEEFVDGIHFLSSLSIELEMDKTNTEIETKVVSEDKSTQLLETFNAIAGLKYKFDIDQLTKAFSLYLGNARLLGISEKEIEEFYVEKNKVNFERLKNGY